MSLIDQKPDVILDGYKRWLNRSRKANTANIYYADAEKFIFFFNKPMRDITVMDVTRYLDLLEDQGLKRSSIYVKACSLKRFFKTIGREDLALGMPTPVYESTHRPRWMVEDQIARLIEAAKPGMEKAMISTAYELALRVGEVPLLKRSWFNRNTGDIKVTRLKRKSYPEDMIHIRKQSFYGSPLDLLNKYLDTREDGLNPMFVVSGGRLGSDLREIADRTVTYRYRKLADRAGIDSSEYTFHTLRHSRLTHMAVDQLKEFGVTDLARIAKFAGHTNINSTLIYTHIAGEWVSLGKQGEEEIREKEVMEHVVE